MIKKRYFTLLLLAIVVISGSSLFSQTGPRITYFSLKSFYFYSMGSFSTYDPTPEHYYELGRYTSSAYAPLFGIGYRFFNFMDRFFINVEGDYALYSFDFGDNARDQKIGALAIMIDGEWFLRRFPLGFSFGIGATIHFLSDLGYYNKDDEYIYTGDDTVAAVTMRFGIKVPLSRRFTLRGEFRWSGESYGGYYNSYYWNDWYYDDTEWDFISSALCIGVEFHL